MLEGKIALVTGASRGVGKGAVLGLCEAGATVYFTARSTRDAGSTGGAPGTIEETAEKAALLGGEAIGLVCDHRQDEQTRAVMERIRADHGRLDLLVNNVWGGYEYLQRGEYEHAGRPSWERPISLWDEMFDAGPRAHYVTSTLAAPLMIERGSGLIVNVSFFAGESFRGDVIYSLAKSTSTRMATHLAEELRPHGVAAVALYPGLVRTESVLAAGDFFDLSNSESPQFVGRAVAALAADDAILERSGQALVVAELGEEYGFKDIDGLQPRSVRAEFASARENQRHLESGDRRRDGHC
jgi:NAD(P)-dependent dehydrogenase (short-subunit alcohol dehydrogenase family)